MRNLSSIVSRLPLVGPAAIDTARRFRYPEIEHAVRTDIAATGQALGWLRKDVARMRKDAGTLLILSLSDMVYQVKLEAMLGAAMRLEGWRVLVLTGSPANLRGKRYFEAFGLDDFLYLDEFNATDEERAEALDAANVLTNGDLDFPTVKGWTFQDTWIGPQILSSISRAQHKGAPDLADPEIHAAMKAILPQLLLRILVAKKVVHMAAPDLGLVIEANDANYGPFVDRVIATGTPVIQVTQPWRDDALTLRRLTAETRRMHPSSVAPETLDRLSAQPWREVEQTTLDAMFSDRYGGAWFLQTRNQPQTKAIARDELVKRFGLLEERKIAVVFSHVLWDANLFYGDDLFDDYGHWFVETIKAAVANPEVDWLIKLHPANLWKRARDEVADEYAENLLIRERIGTLPPHVKQIAPDSDVSTLSLFQNADFGITVRGTCGMEMPCFGKPVLTAGTGRYSGLGFTVDSTSRQEYLEKIANLHKLEPLSDARTCRARWHAYAAFVLRPWRMKSFKSVFDYRETGHHPLDQNLISAVSDRSEAAENGDLARFARWAASNEIDYLEI